MPCSSASSSGSCGVAYPTFSGCESLNFSRVSLCFPLHICFIACLSSLYCGFCRVPIFMGVSDMMRDVGSYWTVFSCFSMDTVASWPDASTACPMLILERLAWPCLPRSWNPPAFRLHCLTLQIAIVYLGLVQDVSDICLPLYLD